MRRLAWPVMVLVVASGSFWLGADAPPTREPNHKSCCDGGELARATCTGSALCRACSDCSRCRHCRDGGRCGVCDLGMLAPRPKAEPAPQPTLPASGDPVEAARPGPLQPAPKPLIPDSLSGLSAQVFARLRERPENQAVPVPQLIEQARTTVTAVRQSYERHRAPKVARKGARARVTVV